MAAAEFPPQYPAGVLISETPNISPREAPAPRYARTRKVVRKTTKGSGIGVSTVLLLLLLVVLLLQWQPVKSWAIGAIINRVNPFPDTELTVEGVRGTIVGSLELSGLRLTRADGTVPVYVDTASVSYRLLPALVGKLRIDRILLAGVRASAVRDSSGVLDLAEPFQGASDTTKADLRVERATVRNSSLSVSDSSGRWAVHNLGIEIRALSTLPALELRLDTLYGAVADPVSSLPGHVAASGRFIGQNISLDSLIFQTSRSQLHASGQWSGAAWPADSLSIHLQATPLYFDDVSPLIPMLAPGQSTTIIARGHAQGQDTRLTLAAQIGGGQVDIDLTANLPDPSSSDSVSIRGSVVATDVDLARVLSKMPGLTPLSTTAEANLAGTSWSTLSGTASLKARQFRWEDIRLADLDLGQSWETGTVTSLMTARINGGRTRVSGTAQPFAEGIPVDATATLSGWDLREWTENTEGSVNATARLRGTFAADRWTADIKLDTTRVGDCLISGPVSATQIPSGLSAHIELEACGGNLVGDGSFVAATQAWQVNRLAISDLAWAGALSDSASSRISAVVTASGLGATYAGSVSMGTLRYADYRVDSLRAEVIGQSEVWRANGTVHTGPGEVSFAGSGVAGIADIERLVVRNLNAAYTAGLEEFDTSISASATGRIGDEKGRLDITVDSSRVNQQLLAGGEAWLDLGQNSLATEGRLMLVSDGYLGWRGAAEIDPLSVTLDSLYFRHLDLSSILPGQVPSDLSGAASGSLQGKLAAGELHLEGGSYNGIPIDAAWAALSASADSARVDTNLGLGGGTLRLVGGLDRVSERYSGRLQLDRVDALRLVALDTLGSSVSGSIDLSGTGLSPLDGGRLTAAIDSLRFAYGGIEVDSAAGRFEWRNGVLDIPSLRLWGDPLSMQLAGSIPVLEEAPSQAYRLDGRISGQNIRPIAELFNQDIGTSSTEIVIQGRGQPSAFRVSVQADVDGLVYGDLHITSSDLLASAELGRQLSPEVAEVRYTGSQLSLPGIIADRATATLSLRNDSLRLETALLVDAGRSLSFAADLDSSRTRFTLTQLNADLDDAEWALVAPADVSLVDGIEISGLVAVADSQRIALGGQAFGSVPDNMYFSASDVRLDAITDILGFAGFGATFSSSLSMTSDGRPESRSISGTLSGDIRHLGDRAGRVDARVAVRDNRLNIDAAIRHTEGAEALVRGFIPLAITADDVSAEPVSLRLDAEDFPVDWTLPFFDPFLVDELDGLLGAQVSVRGTYGEPTLSGSARLLNGRMGLPTLGKPRKSLIYDRMNVFLSLSEDAVSVDSASVRSGNGTAAATGTVQFADLSLGEIDLDIIAREFLAIESAPYRAIIGGDMSLRGTTLAPRLGGRLQVAQGDFYLTDETSAAAFEPVTLSRTDLLTLQERFGIRVSESDTTNFDFYEAMDIQDLRVDLARNTWLRSVSNPKMEIQFSGSIDVAKRPYSDVQVFGTIEVIPDRSQIDQFGRRFEIERGTLTFNGPAGEPDMNLRAVYNVRSRRTQANEVTITLQATGSPQDLELAFSSDPTMELADIVSYIATGRPASQSLQFGGSTTEDYLQSAAGLAMGPITSLVENLAGSGLGLDVVEIEQDESSGLMLTAGKYVSPRFFVSVSQPVSLGSTSQTSSGSDTQVTMEYEIVRSLLVSLLSRGTVLRVTLRWERAY